MKKLIVLAVIVIAVVWFFNNRQQNLGEQVATNTGATVEESGQSKETETVSAPYPAAPGAEETTVESAAPGTGEASFESPAVVSSEKPEPLATVETGSTASVHYFAKVALEACNKNTVALPRPLDSQFQFAEVASLVELTKPLPKELTAENYVSALLPGTRFMNLRVDREGNATADFNEKLNEGLTECIKDQRRAQIVNTLKEFASVKSVTITVGEKVWE